MEQKAQVFILFGQSQAVGHNIPMGDCDKITTPLTNVFGLNRAFNQSYDIKSLTWQGYTSDGMNLGEEQDHTYSVANCLATLWQKEIDGGNNLPDLYIVHIAIGAQGVTSQYMWNPTRKKKLKAGKLGKVDISLYPLAVHVLSLIDDSFKKLGKEYQVMSLYWRGGEEDASVPTSQLKQQLKGTYNQMLNGFYNALGKVVPITLSKLLNEDYLLKIDASGEKSKSMHYINSVFNELASENKNINVFDCSSAPFYNQSEKNKGLFIEDMVHYTPQTNWWVASQILKNFVK